ncbi:MAG: TRAP transporter small permease [Negativicutes bacterium]
MKKPKLVFDVLEKLCIIILTITLIGMIILIFAQVVARYLFNMPFSWTEELARHLMIWAAFVGSALAYRRNAHLGVDLLIDVMSANWRRIVLIAVHTGIAAFALFLCVMGSQVVARTMVQSSSALSIPMGLIYLAIPVGAALMLSFSFEKLYSMVMHNDISGKSQISPEV